MPRMGYWNAHSDRDFEDPHGLLDRDEDPWGEGEDDWDAALALHEAEQSGDTARCPYSIREWALFGQWPNNPDDPWEGIEHSDNAMAMRADDPTRQRREG